MSNYRAIAFPRAVLYPPLKYYDVDIPCVLRNNIQNTKGQINKASLYVCYELAKTDIVSISRNMNRVKTVNSESAFCALAIPMKYVINSSSPSSMAVTSALRPYSDSYIYCYLTNDSKGITYENDVDAKYGWAYSVPKDNGDYNEKNGISNGSLSTLSYSSSNEDSFPKKFFTELIKINDNTYETTGRYLVDDDIKEKINNIIDNNTFEGLRIGFIPFVGDAGIINQNGYDFTAFNVVYASMIATTLPVFTIDNVEGIKNYFDNGDMSGADNGDYLVASQVDLRTDWTIYVRGARYPDIWVTMKSPGLDAFIADKAKNTTGLTAEDFKVQWRYPKDGIEDLGLNDNIIGHKDTTPYGKTLASSWREIVSLDIQGSGQNIDDYIPESFYATLEFRLYYSDGITSEWCYCELGYIGSPSVPAFSKQRNDSGILFVDNGSTVTIVYDEYPSDRDDYVDPDISSDVGDTSPKESGTLGLNKLTTSYKLTNDNLQALGNFLWSKTFLDTVLLVNNNPIECIVGVKMMPIALDGTITEVYIGNVDTKVGGEIITSVPVINVGSIKYDGYYGNFLDYAPFTQVSIFLPFIGFLELDVAQITGHTIDVKYSFDVVLGQCKAMLFVDGIYFLSADGTCGIDIPLMSSNRAQVEAQFAASVLSSLLTGDLMGATAGAITDYVNMQYHYTRSGQYSPTLGWGETRNCYLVIAVPVVNVPSTYAHDFGLPCNLSYGLATLSGYTVCAPDIDLSGIPCTAAEREMIKELLTSGVYL